MKPKHLFLVLITGIYFIYAIFGAAIASATVSGNEALAKSLYTPMMSAGMSWLFIVGIPLGVWLCYGFYRDFLEGLNSFSDELRSLLQKKKGTPQNEGAFEFERLALQDELQASEERRDVQRQFIERLKGGHHEVPN